MYIMSKYNSKKVEIDGIIFDSKDEALYYNCLKDKKLKFDILDFELQPKFILQEGFKKNGKTFKPITYKGDFRVYNLDGTSCIVDVKGMATDVFKIKYKMFCNKFDEELKLIARSVKYGDEYGFIDYFELKKIRSANKKAKKEKEKNN